MAVCYPPSIYRLYREAGGQKQDIGGDTGDVGEGADITAPDHEREEFDGDEGELGVRKARPMQDPKLPCGSVSFGNGGGWEVVRRYWWCCLCRL